MAENCEPGTDDWRIKNHSYSIQGFASESSVVAGENLSFFVTTDARRFDILIYRSGYYGGTGGRLVQVVRGVPGRFQPGCHDDAATGLRSCSNWSESYRLRIPREWVSGIYIAKLMRPDTGGENYLLFVVRDDNRSAQILYQQSVSTYQAYNNFGGKSLYDNSATNECPTVAGTPRAVKVSLDRPYVQPMDDPNIYFRVEYPMVYWLEENGYDVAYVTSLDTHRSGLHDARSVLLGHRVFLSVGHDEYWSQGIRDAITAARDAGVHLAFFSGNTGYCRIRFEPDPWSGKPDRVIVSYKTNPPDPTGDPTSFWRDPQGANDPENALLGIQYIGHNEAVFFPLRVTAEQATDRLYRHTSLKSLPPGTHANIGRELVGWEWDGGADNGREPRGLTILAASPVSGEVVTVPGHYRIGTAEAHTTRYVAPSGAIVFASGTCQWSWGLAVFEPNPLIQQMTYNLLADMGVRPASPVSALVLDDTTTQEVGADHSAGPDGGHGLVISALRIVAAATSVRAAWRTNVATKGQAWLVSPTGETLGSGEGETGGPGQGDVSKGYSLEHGATLVGLTPATGYALRVLSTDASGRSVLSEIRPFRTDGASIVTRVWISAWAAAEVVECWTRPPCRRAWYWVRANLGLGAGIAIAAVLAIVGTLTAFLLGRRVLRRLLRHP